MWSRYASSLIPGLRYPQIVRQRNLSLDELGGSGTSGSCNDDILELLLLLQIIVVKYGLIPMLVMTESHTATQKQKQ